MLRAPRRTETALGALASVVTCAAFVVAALGASRNPQADSLWGSAAWLAAMLTAGAATRLAIKRWAPRSNEILFGLVGALVGIGWVFVIRIDPADAPQHTAAVLVGFGVMAVTVAVMARRRACTDRAGTWALIAVALAAAGSFARGSDVSAGAYEPPRQWLILGPLEVQPYGIAKIAVILAACGLAASAPRWLGTRLVPHRHAAGAIAAAVGAWTLLVVQADFASSVVIFLAAWLPLWLDYGDSAARSAPTAARPTRTRALAGVLITYWVGVVVLAAVYDQLAAQLRFWLNPWAGHDGAAAVQAAFAISAGGISGVGPGLGAPQQLADASGSYVFAVIAEELGILGAAALIAAFCLFVGIGAGIAQRARGTHRLLAAAAAFVIGLQALVSIAGVLRLLPHTVGALPFVSRGPLALIGCCCCAAILLGVSQAASVPVGPSASRRSEPPPAGSAELRASQPDLPSAAGSGSDQPLRLPLGDL